MRNQFSTQLFIGRAQGQAEARRYYLRNRFLLRFVIGLAAVLLLAACQGPAAPEPTPVLPTPTTAPTETPLPTPTPEPMPTATPTPEPTPTPTPLSAAAIFDLVSPSVVYVEAGDRFGSGIVVDGGYVVTNAHVIWPYGQVRVVTPDGLVFRAAPVQGWDLMADIALIGPLEELEGLGLALIDGEDQPSGTDVYLVGYPAEVESDPQPTITRGILSRQREWEPSGLTLLQTDASVAGGQSGGALVSETGAVIGVSGLRFGEADFCLVASASDLVPRIERLMAGEASPELGERALLRDTSEQEYEFSLRDTTSYFAVLIEPDRGEEVDIVADSTNDLNLCIYRNSGWGWNWDCSNEGYAGEERTTITTESTAPIFVVVLQLDKSRAQVRLTSSHAMVRFTDPEDLTEVAVGDTVAGALDYPGDADYFVFELGRNELANIYVSSLFTDPVVEAAYLSELPVFEAYDDDSGGGISGADSSLSVRAREPGKIVVRVRSFNDAGYGSYVLQVRQHSRDLPEAVDLPTPLEVVNGPFGRMRVWQATGTPFSIEVPAGWSGPFDIWNAELGGEFLSRGARLELSVRTAVDADGAPITELEQAANRVDSQLRLEYGYADVTQLSRVTVTLEDGATVVLLNYRLAFPDAVMFFHILVGIEGDEIFRASYVVPEERDAELSDLIDYSLSTFRLRY